MQKKEDAFGQGRRLFTYANMAAWEDSRKRGVVNEC